MIYADNAATTEMSAAAKKAFIQALENCWGNPSSIHSCGQEAKSALEQARKTIAECINAQSEEIYFTSGGSEADNQALISAARLGKTQGKTHIISSVFEHHAVLNTLKKLEKEGFELSLVGVGENGFVSPEAVEAAIRQDTALVSIMYANNELGTIQPIKEIGEICKRKKLVFHTDAVQAAGHIQIDVKRDNIDMMSLSAHKFRGPKGAGILYVRRGIKLYSLIEGGAQEKGRRAGTENVPAIISMSAALKEVCESINQNNEKINSMRLALIKGLSAIPHSRFNGSVEKSLPGTVNFCFEGIEGEAMLLHLDIAGIKASSASACTSGSLEPSHVLLSLGLPHEIAHGSLRFSINEENTAEEIDTIIKKTKEITEYLRELSPVWDDLQKGRKEHLI